MWGVGCRFFFFFFQAEDGIRDLTVTGVQTCALPIFMLYYPLNPEKSFVKRVIAEEGDTVRIVDGRVYVNDIPLKDDYVPSEYRSHDDWGPQVIPEGYYFVMGDHRNNSSDSRHWGMVPKKYIIGKVQLRWWPVPTARVF